MLPPAHRMRRRRDFVAAVKGGQRAAGRVLVVHEAADSVDGTVAGASSDPVLIGFVVPRGVGNAVVRNRVERRLRHLIRPLVPSLPSGARLVVRVLPSAAQATSADLSEDLDQVLARLERRRGRDRAEVRS